LFPCSSDKRLERWLAIKFFLFPKENYFAAMNWTEEQVLSLAPDESAKKSGRELASPSKWVSRSANEKALWGECKGSGANPYKTQIDLSNIAFKCSCPSRKFPCKHGLGRSEEH